jgi:probable FeS assembly SUF system protein SufT
MQTTEIVTLKRTCEAIEIPSGRDMTLFEGTEIKILQRLGGNFTVMTHQFVMASVAGKDADALGKPIPEEAKALEHSEGKTLDDLILAQLKTCYDPEIPYNIVDLGLVYGGRISDLPENGGKKVEIKMTLTAPGCGMGDWLKRDVQKKLLLIPEVKQVDVEMVFDPPWTPERMSPAIKREVY